MANELCVTGFSGVLSGVNGNYYLSSTDLWTNGSYYIFKDSYWWMISRSPFLYGYPTYLVAIKTYTGGSWVNGTYYSVGPWVSGNWTLGTAIGVVALGVCP